MVDASRRRRDRPPAAPRRREGHRRGLHRDGRTSRIPQLRAAGPAHPGRNRSRQRLDVRGQRRVGPALDLHRVLALGLGALDRTEVGGTGQDVDGEVGARFDIETFNGDISNCFGPKAERTSKYAPGWELSFTQGDGDGRVTIATLNGDIDLCQ